MVKKILVKCERSFKIFNRVIGNDEIHNLNEKEILAVLRRPGKITMYELNEDGTQKVPVTLANYSTETIFKKVEAPVVEEAAPAVEEKVDVVAPVVEEAAVEEEKEVEEAAPVVEKKPVPSIPTPNKYNKYDKRNNQKYVANPVAKANDEVADVAAVVAELEKESDE